MDEFEVKRVADHMTGDFETLIMPVYRKMGPVRNSLTHEELMRVYIYLTVQQASIRDLNQAVNTPTKKKTRKFWRR